MKIQSFLSFVVGFLVSICGLTAAGFPIGSTNSVGEHRRYLVAPQGTPVADLVPDSKEGEMLSLEWGSGTNCIILHALFEGEKVTRMKVYVGGREYSTPNADRDGITMEEDEIGIFQRIALETRKGWRTISGLDGTLAYEVEPYTVVSITNLALEKWVIIFKRGENLLAIPNEFWAGGFDGRPDVGEKVIIGRAVDQYCPIRIVNGSPKVPEAMLLNMREYAKK